MRVYSVSDRTGGGCYRKNYCHSFISLNLNPENNRVVFVFTNSLHVSHTTASQERVNGQCQQHILSWQIW